MSDTISRANAIDAAKDWYDGLICGSFKGLEKRLKSLPSAQPERKKGTWIPAFNGKFTGGAYWFNCSECGRIVPEVRNGGWNFCPNCGADMKGEKDEQR